MPSDPDETRARTIKIAGEYELVRRLGTGGFGTVFEARHRETGLPFAVKRVELSEDDAARFRKEALYPARIASQSLHVLSVYSFFQDPAEGLFYLVTELVPHGDLRTFLKNEAAPLPFVQALEIALGIAKGLAAIHEQGIVHGDLKPANILMDRKDNRWIPKIADFGLARSLGSMKVSTFASPGYASPEQMDLIGDRLPGPESDLFSFGMIVFELLSGKRMAPDTNLRDYGMWLADRQGHAAATHAATGAVAPTSAQELRPECAPHPELLALLSGVLEFDRSVRLRSATAIVETLSGVLQRAEREARPPSVAATALSRQHTRAAEPRGQDARPGRLYFGAVVVAALVFVAALTVWLTRSAEPETTTPAAAGPNVPAVVTPAPDTRPAPAVAAPAVAAPAAATPAAAAPATAGGDSTIREAAPAQPRRVECDRLLERWNLGDTLTDGEQALLRQCQ